MFTHEYPQYIHLRSHYGGSIFRLKGLLRKAAADGRRGAVPGFAESALAAVGVNRRERVAAIREGDAA